jgi:hypothetical protein
VQITPATDTSGPTWITFSSWRASEALFPTHGISEAT